VSTGTGSLVSVIVPVHDGLPLLEETVASVEAQTHGEVERIAVDDGSSDGSGDWLRARAGWRVLPAGGLGTNRARALGLAEAVGDFVALLDQDDLWHPQHLARCLDALREHPDAPAAIGRRRTFHRRAELALSTVPGPTVRRDPWRWYPFAVIDTPSMAVFRRGSLDVVGGWPADRAVAADLLAWLRLGALGPLAVSASRTVGVRLAEGSRSAVHRRDPLAYLAAIRSSARDAVEALPPGRREAAAGFGEAILGDVARLLEALRDGGAPGGAARSLEAHLRGCPDGLVLVAVRFLGWLATGGGDGPRRVSEAALLGWPADAPRTGREMRRLAATLGGPAMLARARPAAFARTTTWLCAAESAFHRAAGLLGRQGDPLDLDLAASPWTTGGAA